MAVRLPPGEVRRHPARPPPTEGCVMPRAPRLSVSPLALSIAVGLAISASARAQNVGVGVGVGPRPYGGLYGGISTGYLGVYPGGYNGFWSNGFSMYGPPVPTYGSVPGYFGGVDQRLT